MYFHSQNGVCYAVKQQCKCKHKKLDCRDFNQNPFMYSEHFHSYQQKNNDIKQRLKGSGVQNIALTDAKNKQFLPLKQRVLWPWGMFPPVDLNWQIELCAFSA